MPNFNLNETVFVYIRTKKNNTTEEIPCDTAYFVAKCITGKVRFYTNNTEFILLPGEMLFIPKSEPYSVHYYDSETVECAMCQCRFIPGIKRHDYSAQKFTPTDEVTELFSDLNFGEVPISCSAYGKFYYALGKILPLLKRNYSTAKDEKIFEAIAYMEKNDRYDIPTLAKLCNMSESGFYAAFKKITGLTPIEKKHAIQAQKAEILLKTTNLSVEDICDKIGFNSVKHFRNVMLKRYNQTPFQIRKGAKLK